MLPILACSTDKCTWTVYSVVLDSTRNLACSGSMDGTVRVWDLSTGECQHTLTGHTSLVGLLGLSPSHLVSAAADSTLRVWDIESGELRHTLAAHNGAITCFQHDEFKVLSGSDGTLKMWDIRDGSQVRDLLTGIVGVWQVVFEGRWCVAASNRMDATVLDVWDFGLEEDDDWEGEPPGGIYDEESDYEVEEDEDLEQAEVDAMDQDLEGVPSDAEFGEGDEYQDSGVTDDDERSTDWGRLSTDTGESVDTRSSATSFARRIPSVPVPLRGSAVVRSSVPPLRILSGIDETPTRPRVRNHLGHRRR